MSDGKKKGKSKGQKVAKAIVDPVVLAVTKQPVGAVVTAIAMPFRIVGAVLGIGDDDDD